MGESFDGAEARFVVHSLAALDPVAEIDVVESGLGGTPNMVENDVCAEARSARMVRIIEAVDHRETIGLAVGETAADEATGPAVDDRLAIFENQRVDRRLLDHVAVIVGVHPRHSAFGMTAVEIAAQQVVLLVRGPGLAGADVDIGVAAQHASLRGAWRELLGNDADGDACLAALAARSV